ncbi:pre-toxin TG domain-containing protein [Metasolibacillus sp. FSL H7-0170]|uniref:pre-toxin TG domain-containing protein n=1 Tax=Metasolibacillus sp. FSL H7-0170 TaxID=2921431 RepID=UPI0031598ADC
MGKFWKSIGKAIASIPVVGNAIKSAKKTAQKVKTEVKKVAEKVEAKLTELKESVEELLEEVEESVEEALGKVTTYARKLQNNLDELALVQWVKNDAKSFVLAAYKKTKKWVKGGWREGLSIGVDFIPIVGNLKAGIEAVIGIDPITGRKLSTAERAIVGAAIIGGPLVKGAKHVGKGAMKIIPNSNKLVNSLSKLLAKLKEGGQKVAEKAAAKAAELKAQANAMMAQAKQGMRESMDNVGRALRGNEPALATAGGPPVKNSPVRDWDSTVQRSTENSSGAGKLDKDLAKAYLRDIEMKTGRKVHKEQIDYIKEALRNNKFEKLTPKETAKHRRKFTTSLKDRLIIEWEEKTNQKWPRYTEEVFDKNGEVARSIGQPYDAHHIIENNFGGPHEWWNIHPAKYPDEHQAGIHGKGSPSGKLFPRR